MFHGPVPPSWESVNAGEIGSRIFFRAARSRAPLDSKAFRRAVRSLDRNLPARDVMPLESYIAQKRLNDAVFGKLFSSSPQ
jgi:hypothetical protein